MLNETQKQSIQAKLKAWVGIHPSQSAAVAKLDSVSEATVVQILKGNWANISDAMWRNVGNQVGWNEKQVTIVETMNMQTLLLYYDLAKQHGETFALVGPAGSGKTFTGRWYAQALAGQNVYYLECAGYWNKKYFLQEVLKAMGRDNSGMNTYEMMNDIISACRKQDRPVIILDEIDKLSDPVLLFFITLYNDLKDKCGFVWQSTDSIQKRIKRGLAAKRMGYNELFSRIGRKFIELPGINREEIKELCMAHGITDQQEIAYIVNECEGDLRRIDRHQLKNIVIKRKKQAENHGR